MTSAVLVAPRGVGAAPAFRIGRPLTERVLDRLPGPRLTWMLAWGLSPFAAYETAHRLWQLPTYAGAESNLVIAVCNLVGLWAAGRLASRIASLQPHLAGLLEPDDLDPQRHPFRHVGSIRGPLAVAALLVLSWDVLDFLAHPGFANAFTVVTVGLGMTAIAQFLWVYLVALVGLDRIGRRRLRLTPFTTDPHLGLKPLGSLAFEAFLLSAAAVAPALVWLLTDVRSTVSTLGMVAAVSGLFVLSAYTLHRQLVVAKAERVRWAHGLVEAVLRRIDPDVGGPVSDDVMTETLAQARPALAAATEIERRAVAIQEWPFDSTIIRTVAAILTSVTAVVIARFLLSRLGM